ncbi:MAG: dockerin type I domain-containing protein [Ruminococcus sp.]|nr:dockerin type I domain-containing protein [Ruminococcus sp.]
MKTSKKFIAGVSAFVVAVSSIAITVSAVTESEGLTISVSSTTSSIEADSTFEVTVDLANVPDTGIAGCEFAVYYDASMVEVVDVESEDLTGAAAAELELQSELNDTMVSYPDYSCFDYYDSDGKIACLWATGLENSSYWINEDGTLVTITFQAKDSVSDGDVVSIGIASISDTGSVVFAAADDEGTYYAYDNVTIGDEIQLSVGGSGVVTDPTETDPTETDPTDTTLGGSDSDTVLLGDVNADGSVKSNDLLLLKKYLLGLSEESDINFVNSDVTKDGDIKSNDLLLLKKYLLGLEDLT